MKQAKFGRTNPLTRNFVFSEVIIGHSLNALAHSVVKSVPIIYNAQKDFAYDVWDSVDPNLNLDKIFCVNEQRSLLTLNGETKIFGALKQDLHSKMVFLSAMSGFIPFGDKVELISVNKHDVQVVLSSGNRYTVNYKLAHIYNDNMIAGGSEIERNDPKKVKTTYEVKDYYQLSGINKHDMDFLHAPEPFTGILPLIAIDWEYYTSSTFNTKTPHKEEYHQIVFLEKIERLLKQHFPTCTAQHKMRDIIKITDNVYKEKETVLFPERISFEEFMTRLNNETSHYNHYYRALDYLLTDKYYDEVRKFKEERTR